MSSQHFIRRDNCPGCRSTRFNHIYQKPYTEPPISDYLSAFYSPQGGVDFNYLQGADYHLSACQDCTMIFQREVPGDHLMEVLYEEWIDPKKVFLEHQRTDRLKKYTHYAEEIATMIAFFKAVPSSLKFLDFGMGWGSWAQMAKALGCNAYGTELSQQRIDYAMANGVKIMTWDDIPAGNFDFINTEQVFEHLSAPLETLLHLKQGLNKNGILKISVPTVKDIDRRLELMDWKAERKSKNSLNGLAPMEHINYFKTNSLIKMADIAGMAAIEIPSKHHHMFTPRGKGLGHIFKETFFPKKRNKNYMFFRVK